MLLFLRQMTYYLINLSLDLPLSYILTYSANIVIFFNISKRLCNKFELIYINIIIIDIFNTNNNFFKSISYDLIVISHK